MAFKKALEKHRVAGTATFTFDKINLSHPEPPVLTCRFAGRGTPGFVADAIKLANAARDRSDKASERKLQEIAERTADLISRHCVESWSNVCEDEAPGVCAPCTPEKVKEMLLGVYDVREDQFTDFVMWIRNPDSFPNAGELAASGAALGKP